MKKCDPLEATEAFDVETNGLQALQPTGMLNCKQIGRIGRNCINKKWHTMHDQDKCPPFFFYPHHWEDIKKWLKKDMVSGEFFEDPPADGWDFIFISW